MKRHALIQKGALPLEAACVAGASGSCGMLIGGISEDTGSRVSTAEEGLDEGSDGAGGSDVPADVGASGDGGSAPGSVGIAQPSSFLARPKAENPDDRAQRYRLGCGRSSR